MMSGTDARPGRFCPSHCDAHASYWSRIRCGTDHTLEDALRVRALTA